MHDINQLFVLDTFMNVHGDRQQTSYSFLSHVLKKKQEYVDIFTCTVTAFLRRLLVMYKNKQNKKNNFQNIRAVLF